MKKDSFIFYKSFYDAIKEMPTEMQVKLYNAIFAYQFEEKEEELEGVEKAVFTLIKPQLNANNTRYENGCKGAKFGKLGGRPKKEKPLENPTGVMNENPTKTPNENDNENENDNDTAIAVIESDSRADGSHQPDSCVDEVVKFYEQNFGTISPFIFETLNDYRDDFTDDIIIYAMQLAVEANAKTINYTKAILNNWQKANVKSLLDAQNENKRNTKVAKELNNTHKENAQFGDLNRFYIN